MGTALSRSVDISVNEYLIRFVGKEYISPNDPFWNRFLAFNITPPKSRYSLLIKIIYISELKTILVMISWHSIQK